MIFGLLLPFILVNWLIVTAFAQTLYVSGAVPESAVELAAVFAPLLGSELGAIFHLACLAIPVTTIVVLMLFVP